MVILAPILIFFVSLGLFLSYFALNRIIGKKWFFTFIVGIFYGGLGVGFATYPTHSPMHILAMAVLTVIMILGFFQAWIIGAWYDDLPVRKFRPWRKNRPSEGLPSEKNLRGRF